MLGTRRFLLGTTVLSATLAFAPQASAFDKGYLWMGVFSKGPAQGVVVLQQTGAHSAQGSLALGTAVGAVLGGALGTGARYRVVWSTKPCSQTVASPAAKSGNEVAIESLELAHEGLNFVTRPIALRADMEKGRSIRVFSQGTQLACTRGVDSYMRPAAAAVFRGNVQGIVAAVRRPGARSRRVYVALRGLSPDTRYRVTASGNRCSKPDTAAERAFGVGFRTHPGEDDWFASSTVPGRPSRVASFRVRPAGPARAECRPLVGLGSY